VLRSFLPTNEKSKTHVALNLMFLKVLNARTRARAFTRGRAKIFAFTSGRAKERGGGRGGGKKERMCKPAARTKVGRAQRSPTA
jgi:hypothetical protein